jgi:hypothetical protein
MFKRRTDQDVNNSLGKVSHRRKTVGRNYGGTTRAVDR